jgi:hypothetical protein
VFEEGNGVDASHPFAHEAGEWMGTGRSQFTVDT